MVRNSAVRYLLIKSESTLLKLESRVASSQLDFCVYIHPLHNGQTQGLVNMEEVLRMEPYLFEPERASGENSSDSESDEGYENTAIIYVVPVECVVLFPGQRV